MNHRLAVSLCLGLLAFAQVGCESTEEERRQAMLGPRITEDDVTNEAILDDLTPELTTLAERPIDVDANVARQFNNDWRQFWEDWGRVFLLNDPIRLSPKPIP